MGATIHDLLALTVERGASDLHITSGTYPQIRLHGDLVPLTEFETLTPEDAQRHGDGEGPPQVQVGRGLPHRLGEGIAARLFRHGSPGDGPIPAGRGPSATSG